MRTERDAAWYSVSATATREYKNALPEWLGAFPFEYFITLTFSSDVSQQTAVDSLKHYQKRLSHTLYGRRALASRECRISFVAGLERQPGGRLHWHLLVQPLAEPNKLPANRLGLKWRFLDPWKACRGSGKQFDLQVINKDDTEKVIDYVCKEARFNPDAVRLDWFHART